MARILPPSVFKANFEAAEFKPTQTQRVAERFATPEGLKLGVNIVDQAGGTIRDAVTQYARKRALIAAGKDPTKFSYEAGMGQVAAAKTADDRAAGYETMRKAFDRPGSGRLLGDPTRAPSRLMRQDYEALAKASPLPKAPGPGKAPSFFPEPDDDLATSKQLGESFDRAVSVRRSLMDANGRFQAVDLRKTVPPDIRQKLLASGAYVPHVLMDENGQQIQTVRLRRTAQQQAELDALGSSEKDARLRLLDEANFARGLALMNNAGSPNLNTAYKNFQVYQNTLARLRGFRQARSTQENINEVNRLRNLLNQTGVQTFRGSSLGNFLQNYQPPKPDPGETTGDGKAKGTGQSDVTGGPSTPVGSLAEAAQGFSDEEKQELAAIVSEKGVNSKEYKETADKIKRRKLAVAGMSEADTEGLRSSPELLTAKPSLVAPGPAYLDDAEFFAGRFSGEDEAALQAVYPEEKRNLDRATNLKTRLTDPKDEAFIPRDPDAADRAIATRLPGYQSFSKTNRPKRPVREMRKETDARTLAARRRLTAQMAGRPMPLTAEETTGKVKPLAPPQAVASGSQPFKAGSLTRAQVIKMATIPRSKGKDLVPNNDRVNDLMADLARGELFKPNPNPKGEKIGGTPELKAMAKKAAKKHGVPEALFLALINKESRFRPSSVSHMNAVGIAQMLPTTFRDTMGKNAKASDLFKPEVALDASAKHMARLIKKFKGKDGMKKAIAAYNAGEGNVRRRGLYGFQMVKNKKTGKPYKLYGVLEPQFASGQTRDYLFDKKLGIYNAYKASLPKSKKKKDIADKPGPKAPKERS